MLSVKVVDMAPTTIAPSERPRTFQARTRFQAAHPTALAFYCADGRFTEAVEELLRSLGHARLDTLTLPGGPALLNVWSSNMAEHGVASNAADFLVERHGIVQAVLVAHEACGYYRHRFPTERADAIRKRQVADLRAAH